MLSRGKQEKPTGKDAMEVLRGHRTEKEMSGDGTMFPADPTVAKGKPWTLHWVSVGTDKGTCWCPGRSAAAANQKAE